MSNIEYTFEDLKDMIDYRENPPLTISLIKRAKDKRVIEHASKSRHWEFRLAAVEAATVPSKILGERSLDRNPMVLTKVAEHLSTPKYGILNIVRQGPKITWKYVAARPDVDKDIFKELFKRGNLDVFRALAASPYLWDEAYEKLSEIKDEDTVVNLLRNKYAGRVAYKYLGTGKVRDYIIGTNCRDEHLANLIATQGNPEAKVGLIRGEARKEKWWERLCNKLVDDLDYQVRLNARKELGLTLAGIEGCGHMKVKDLEKEVFW